MEHIPMTPDVVAFGMTGSSFTCNPPVMDTDIDYHVLVANVASYEEHLMDLGWEPGGSGSGTGCPVHGWRLGQVNLIITNDLGFFNRLQLATRLAKQFNLLDKLDRVALFEAVADDFYWANKPDTDVPF